MTDMIRKISILLILSTAITASCMSPQPTRYESTETEIDLPRAPSGTQKVKVALIPFRDLTGKRFLVKPATSQLTTLMIQSGYFDVIEPGLVENIIPDQTQVSPEKLKELQEKFGADIFLTGTLTNFEIRENKTGFCLLFGLLGSYSREEYIVETGIDYRIVKVPSGKILDADAVENTRTDSSRAAGLLFSYSGAGTDVIQSSGGKLLRYAMADMIKNMLSTGKYRQ